MVTEIEREGAGILYANYNQIDENGKIVVDGVNVSGEIHNHAGCALMDKRLINEVRFREGLRHWDSRDLFNRVKGKFKIHYMRESAWYYRVHPGSMSQTRPEERAEVLAELEGKPK